jgi:fatty acid desaturase
VTAATETIFVRDGVTARDQRVFVTKVVFAGVLLGLGVFLATRDGVLPIVLGVFLIGATYTHMVELQHQCLHHSAMLHPADHRRFGFPLGALMLVSFSHYRVRHLQHHRYLGTDQDTEFFGFDTRQPLTPGALFRGLFDYMRLVHAVADMVRCWRGTWRYTDGQISERMHRHVITEYRVLSVLVLAAGAIAAAGHWRLVLLLWVAPLLLVATPLHFLVELPEHIGCDNDSQDVLRNTRSITGSRLSNWYTNGNNLHIEHHATMAVPINRLPERHAAVLAAAAYTNRTYWEFYRGVLAQVVRGGRGTA